MSDSITDLLPARRGHFRFESGHHGDLWLELDPLWSQPERLTPWVTKLASLLVRHRPDAFCGPQTGGTQLARLIAAQLGLPCYAAEKIPPREIAAPAAGLYRTRYSLSAADRAAARNQRIALVDDVINAGSATRATLAELINCGAQPVALGALLVLNDHAARLAARHQIPLESFDQRESNLWEPSTCPLCATGVPLITPN